MKLTKQEQIELYRKAKAGDDEAYNEIALRVIKLLMKLLKNDSNTVYDLLEYFPAIFNKYDASKKANPVGFIAESLKRYKFNRYGPRPHYYGKQVFDEDMCRTESVSFPFTLDDVKQLIPLVQKKAQPAVRMWLDLYTSYARKDELRKKIAKDLSLKESSVREYVSLFYKLARKKIRQ